MPLPSHARSFTLSARLERNTKTSPQYGFARNASLTSADSVCTDLRKSTGCAAITTLRSARSAITSGPMARPSRWGGVEAVIGALVWTLVLIAISFVLKYNGIHLFENYHKVAGH